MLVFKINTFHHEEHEENKWIIKNKRKRGGLQFLRALRGLRGECLLGVQFSI